MATARPQRLPVARSWEKIALLGALLVLGVPFLSLMTFNPDHPNESVITSVLFCLPFIGLFPFYRHIFLVVELTDRDLLLRGLLNPTRRMELSKVQAVLVGSEAVVGLKGTEKRAYVRLIANSGEDIVDWDWQRWRPKDVATVVRHLRERAPQANFDSRLRAVGDGRPVNPDQIPELPVYWSADTDAVMMKLLKTAAIVFATVIALAIVIEFYCFGVL